MSKGKRRTLNLLNQETIGQLGKTILNAERLNSSTIRWRSRNTFTTNMYFVFLILKTSKKA